MGAVPASGQAASRRPALHVVETLDASLALAGASAATRRQRRWALTEAIQFAASTLGEAPEQVDADALVQPDLATAWLASAAAGATHSRGRDRHASAAALRARRASLRALAHHLELPAPDIVIPAVPTAMRPSATEARAAIRTLLDGPPPRMQRSTWARTATLASLVVDSGERTGALTGLTVDALDHSTSALRLGDHEIVLSPETRTVLPAWLEERAALIRRLEGSAPPQLWVTTRTVNTGRGHSARLHPAGLPLTERALHQSHRRALQRLVLSGAHADVLRLGQLRPQE